MILITCIDDKWGLSFNNRCQSRDKKLNAHILERVGERVAWTTHYTAKMLFPDDCKRPLTWCVSNIPLRSAMVGEVCFAEDLQGEDIKVAIEQNWIEEIWLYHWNRSYPGDNFFPQKLCAPQWELVASTELTGSSHPVILEEIYEKRP